MDVYTSFPVPIHCTILLSLSVHSKPDQRIHLTSTSCLLSLWWLPSDGNIVRCPDSGYRQRVTPLGVTLHLLVYCHSHDQSMPTYWPNPFVLNYHCYRKHHSPNSSVTYLVKAELTRELPLYLLVLFHLGKMTGYNRVQSGTAGCRRSILEYLGSWCGTDVSK